MPEALVINDTSWSGYAASYMLTRPVVSADTIEKGCVMIQDDIRKQWTLPRIEVSNFMQPRAATPVSQGTVTVDSAVLAPKDLMLYYEFDPRDYEAHFYAEQLQPMLINRELPPTAEEFMMLQTMKRLNEFFENAFWRSRIMYNPAGLNINPTSKGAAATDSAYYYFDGFIEKALASGSTIQVPSPVTLTSSNIVSTGFQPAYLLVPPAQLYKYGPKGLKFMISYPDQQNYEFYMQTVTTFKNQDTTQTGINRYNGYDVVPLAGMPASTFFLGIGKPDRDSNLWVGVNSAAEEGWIAADGRKAILELAHLQPNSELFFVKGLFKVDTQIGFTDQEVVYTLQTA
ncbi:MAG TPA: hypothetical protein VKQ52_07060 [Puia sp.]|nr:hypothetical protein [Puia sp.]